jgi:HlyD family secretion protein
MRRTAWVTFFFLLLALVYGLGTYTGPRLVGMFGQPNNTNSNDISHLESRSCLGRFQPSRGIISIIAPPGDRIERVLVRQGERIEQGKPLVELASLKDRTQELKLVEEQRKEARKQRDAIIKARTARLVEFDEQLESLKANFALDQRVQALKVTSLDEQLKTARNQLHALMQLNPRIVEVSPQEMQKAKLVVSQAQAEFSAAQSMLKAVESKFNHQRQALDAQKKAILADFDFRLDSVPLGSLDLKADLVKLQVERTLMKAPVTGTVLKVNAHEGASTGTGPIVEMVASDAMVVIAEVYATDVPVLLDWLDKGKQVEATISSPTLGKEKLAGRITDPRDIARSVKRNEVAGFSPRADSDRRIVEARVQLDEESARKASGFLGLEVTIEFKPGRR